MFRSFLQAILRAARSMANIGVRDWVSVPEKSKIRVLNIGVILGLPTNIGFGIVNFVQGKPLLGSINLSLALGGVLVLTLHHYGKFFVSRVLLSCLASLLFFTISILYRNGTESSILAIMIFGVLFFNERKFVVIITFFNFLLFIIVRICLLYPPVYSTVPTGRVIFNIVWSLSIVILSLIYVRREQEDYQAQIEKNNRELKRLNSNKEKLFSIIAHDLRSPIGQLKTLIDLVNAQHISIDKFKTITAKLSLEVDQLHDTMDSLLTWSISQSQGIKAIPTQVALAPLLQQTEKFFHQKLEQKNIRLVIDDAGLSVFADPNHVDIIIRNLVSNALKYSRPGGIILIRSYALDKEVVIQVIDQGVGIPGDVKDSLFSSSANISHMGTANEKGTGLGLKLCKEFVEENKGRIWLESEENKGSTFSIALPVKA